MIAIIFQNIGTKQKQKINDIHNGVVNLEFVETCVATIENLKHPPTFSLV